MIRLAYSVEDAARMVAMGRSTLYEAIAAGEIPAVRVGRRLRITHDALMTYLAEREAAHTGIDDSLKGSPDD